MQIDGEEKHVEKRGEGREERGKGRERRDE